MRGEREGACASRRLTPAPPSPPRCPQAVRRLQAPGAADAYYHLEPFSDAQALGQLHDLRVHELPEASASASADDVDRIAATAHRPAALPAEASTWSASGAAGAPYDHPRWLSSVVAPLLDHTTDPLLRACAPLAAKAPRFAAALLSAAFADVASQRDHGPALAEAVHAALGGAAGPAGAPLPKTVAILHILTSLVRASVKPVPPSTTDGATAAAARPPRPTATPLASSAFWAALDPLALAEAAAAHSMDASALLLVEVHRSAAPPAAAAGVGSEASRTAALLRTVLTRVGQPDATGGLSSLISPAHTAAAVTAAAGPWRSRELAMGVADVALRDASRPEREVREVRGELRPAGACGDGVGGGAGSFGGLQALALHDALGELRALGCFALTHALTRPPTRAPRLATNHTGRPVPPQLAVCSALGAGPSTGGGGGGGGWMAAATAGAAEARLTEAFHETAWRLGDWADAAGWPAPVDAVHGGGGAERLDGGCHEALSCALRLLAREEDEATASVRRVVGGAQQQTLLELVRTHPEAGTAVRARTAELMLCATVREGGAGSGDRTRDAPSPDGPTPPPPHTPMKPDLSIPPTLPRL